MEQPEKKPTFELLTKINNSLSKAFNLRRECLLITPEYIQRDTPKIKHFVESFIHQRPREALELITKERFDLILGDLPFGLGRITWVYTPKK